MAEKPITWFEVLAVFLVILVITSIISCWIVHRYEPDPDGVHELEAELELNDYGWSDEDPIIFGTWKSNERTEK